MEQLAVGTSTDLINWLSSGQTRVLPFESIESISRTHRRVKVDEDGSRDIFPAAGLGEEGLKRAALANIIDSFRIKTTVRLEAMFEQVPGEDRR